MGHPRHPLLSDSLITREMHQQAESDPLFRARRFLQCITGAELLPTVSDERSTIQLDFVSDLGSRYQHARPDHLAADAEWHPSYPPFFFRTCSKAADIPVSRDLLLFLAARDPENDNEASDFDAWVHCQLLEPAASGDWNAL